MASFTVLASRMSPWTKRYVSEPVGRPKRLPAYLSASRFVNCQSGRSACTNLTKFFPMNPAPPVTSSFKEIPPVGNIDGSSTLRLSHLRRNCYCVPLAVATRQSTTAPGASPDGPRCVCLRWLRATTPTPTDCTDGTRRHGPRPRWPSRCRVYRMSVGSQLLNPS